MPYCGAESFCGAQRALCGGIHGLTHLPDELELPLGHFLYRQARPHHKLHVGKFRVVLDLLQRQGLRVVAGKLYIGLIPAGHFAGAAWVIAIRSRIKLGRIGVGVAGDAGFANNGGDRAAGMINQHGIAGFHFIAKTVACLIIAHAIPAAGGILAVAQIIDAEGIRFCL